MGESATPLFDPNAFMAFEARFTRKQKNYTMGDQEMPPFPERFVRAPVDKRFVEARRYCAARHDKNSDRG
ncbi:hypothetical protein [Caballeronia sp. J97]|uniref:hypothetical protein n=1 Tax=Caballeronia sp. J97 TaxID=2805429 RepID=UPI002AB01B77|nr:hypothetical protein [Caballeronia sp. J97]